MIVNFFVQSVGKLFIPMHYVYNPEDKKCKDTDRRQRERKREQERAREKERARESKRERERERERDRVRENT